MATNAPWMQLPVAGSGNLSPYSNFSNYGSLGTGSFGVGEDSQLGNTIVNPAAQTAGAPSWAGIPKLDFPMAGNGPVASNWWDGALGSKGADGMQTPGWGGLALGTAQGLFSGYMGMKNYGLAKDSLAQGKKQFQMNYDAQKTTTNTAMEDRQRARVANNPNSVAVNDYMNKNRIA